MKLTQKTFSILKNFSSINQSLYVTKGNVLRTMSEMKSVMAEAEIQEMFPQDFGIYDLNQFLGVLSLFEEPDLDFDTSYVRIKGGQNASSNYFYADKATIRTMPPEKSFVLLQLKLLIIRIAQVTRSITRLVRPQRPLK